MTSDSLANWTFYLHWLLFALVSLWSVDALYLSSSPNNLDVLEGANGTLSCRSSLSSHVECQWLHSDTQVQVGSNSIQWETSPEQGDCSIKIMAANAESHEGKWQCTIIVTGSTITFVQSDPVLLSVLVEPTQMEVNVSTTGEWKGQLALLNGTLSIPTHTHVALQCHACCANPPAHIMWLRQDEGSITPINTTGDKIREGASGSTLHLVVSRQNHGLALFCLIFHPTFSNTSWRQDVTFDVLYAPDNVTQEQKAIGQPLSPVTLECPLHANPTPSYAWSVLSEDQEWQGLNDSHDSRLQLSGSVPSGMYQCTATTAILTRQFIATTVFNLTRLELTTQPEVTTKLVVVPTTSTTTTTTQSPRRTVATSLNTDLTLTCPSKLMAQESNITLQWYFRGLNSSSWHIIDSQGVNLTLTNISYSEIGMYICVAGNSSLGNESMEFVILVVLQRPIDASPFISAQIVEMIIILSSASLLICLLLLVVITRLKMWSDRRNQSRASDTPSCSGSETKYKKADSWPKVYRGHNTARVYAVIADVKDLHKAGEREEMSSPKPKNTEHTAVNNRKSSATAAKTRKHIAKMNGTMHLHQTSKLKEKNELTEIVSEKEKKTELNGVPHQPKEGDAQDKLGFHETIADVKPDCTEQPEPNSKTDVKNTPEETKIAEQDSLSELHQTTEVTDQTELNGTPEIVQPPEVSGMTQHNDGSELNKTNEPGEVNEINAALDLSVQQDIRRLSGSSVFQLTPDGSRKAETYLRKHSYSLSTESISGYSGRFLPKSSERTIQSGRRGGTPIGPDGRPIWRV